MTDNPQLLEFKPGSKFDGYIIEKMIGEGGMARLFLAHDENSRKRVLKVPRRTFDADPVAVVAFENELRLARYLEDFPYAHMPVSQNRGDCQYLVMDYIEGTNLWTHLGAHHSLGESDAVSIAKKVVFAMSELHRRRIVHLDIKLSNVMITPEGDIRLIDFGLANHLDLHDLIFESFQEPKGTPAYIAPEQFFGVRDEPRSDIFSIGVMLYEMTTSKLPFYDAQSELDVINRIKSEAVPPKYYRSDLSDGFNALVMTCLENVPSRRFASMTELREALEALEKRGEVAKFASSVPLSKPGRTSSELIGKFTGKFLRVIRSFENDKLAELKAWIADHQARRTQRFRIIAALDNDGSESSLVMNCEILEQAVRQAGLQPSIITVLTVLRSHNIAIVSTDRERRELNEAYQDARESMMKVISGFASEEMLIVINIRSGEPAEAIAKSVVDLEANLLIIGARKRHALSRFMLGSTAYKVLTTIKCPVIVIKEGIERKQLEK